MQGEELEEVDLSASLDLLTQRSAAQNGENRVELDRTICRKDDDCKSHVCLYSENVPSVCKSHG